MADVVAAMSLVTADQALVAARAAAHGLPKGAFWFDMNSVAPGTKREAALAIESAGARYVDVAVMAPVLPARCAVALLVSGPHAEPATVLLQHLGFGNVRVVPGEVGLASSIKMIRSVMVKGIEALTAECVVAADRAGVLDEVLASLDASPPPAAWSQRADHNLDRMMVHGLRRAAEMDEVAKTLETLGVPARLSQGAASCQREIGAIGLIHPPSGLQAKIALLNAERAG